MSENRNPTRKDTATFDFAKAVADARRDFPEETKGVTFVDLDAPDAPARIAAWQRNLAPDEREALADDLAALTPGSSGFALRVPGRQMKILGMHSKFCPELHILESAPGKQAEFVFHHEVGHLVVRGADFAESYAECAADAFAVGRGLQNGSLTERDAETIVADRVRQYILFADVLHLSVAAISRVKLDAAAPGFSALEPRALAALAARHADPAALGPAMRQKFDAALNAPEDADPRRATQTMLRAVSRILLENEAGSAPFQVAAHILYAFAKGGFLDGIEKNTGHAGDWEKVRLMLAAGGAARAAVKGPAPA